MDTVETNTIWMGPMLKKIDDIMYILPKGLNTIHIESNYKETSVKNVKGVYFSYAKYQCRRKPWINIMRP